MKWRGIVELFKDTFQEWRHDDASTLSAALAYYTIISLAPLLVIIIGLVAFIFGKEAAQGQVMQQLASILGPQSANTLREIVEHSPQRSVGIVATAISVVVLAFSAAGVFYQLQTSLNTVWEVTPKSSQGFWSIIRSRLPSLSIIPVIGFLLIVSLAASTAVAAFGTFMGGLFPGITVLLQIAEFVISFGVIAILFSLIYKILPDVRVRWRDVWLGGAFTSLLFTLGKFCIGLYLGKSSMASGYGAAGSLVVLLVWVYYSAQIFFFGAEFTQLYTNRYGSRMKPTTEAASLPGEDPGDKRHPSHPEQKEPI
ncbi:MAG TPA: YihY/virulence factor BrkB family protein [Syntrophorhabdaceae bacterium]|jgi:membrane protein